jgi:hypothetical protein
MEQQREKYSRAGVVMADSTEEEWRKWLGFDDPMDDRREYDEPQGYVLCRDCKVTMKEADWSGSRYLQCPECTGVVRVGTKWEHDGTAWWPITK